MALEPQNWLAEGDPYWILGIALSMLMVGMAAGTIVINSAAHLSNVRRASARLQSWLTLSDRATENQALARDVSARGVGAALGRSYARLWLIFRVNLTRRRYLDDVETIRRRNRKTFIDRQLPALESRGTGKHGATLEESRHVTMVAWALFLGGRSDLGVGLHRRRCSGAGGRCPHVRRDRRPGDRGTRGG